MQYLTVQTALTERKKSLITVFPQFVKNNGKEGMKLSKVRMGEKWLAQISGKIYMTERKLERTRIKIMFSTFPSSAFSHKVHTISDLKSNMYSILPNGNRTWTTIGAVHQNLKVL